MLDIPAMSAMPVDGDFTRKPESEHPTQAHDVTAVLSRRVRGSSEPYVEFSGQPVLGGEIQPRLHAPLFSPTSRTTHYPNLSLISANK